MPRKVAGVLLLLLAAPLSAQTQPDPFHIVPAGGGGTGVPGEGTVTSVGLAAPADLFSVSNSPVTSAGTLTLTKATAAANTCYAGPVSGGAAAPTFRLLVAADIPGTIASDTTGNADTATVAAGVAANSVALGPDTTGGYAGSATEAGPATSALSVTGFTGSRCARFDGGGNLVAASADCTAGDTSNVGTVTSVSGPAEFSWATATSTPTATWASQAQNLVLASPNGSSGTPAFRAIADDDVPNTITKTGTANRCAHFDGTGVLVAASGDCASGDTGGGVSGLTTADGGDAIADNEIIRGDGATGIQGSSFFGSDTGILGFGGLTGAQPGLKHLAGSVIILQARTADDSAHAALSSLRPTYNVSSDVTIGTDIIAPHAIITNRTNSTELRTITLPASPANGEDYVFVNIDADGLKVLAQGSQVIRIGSGVSAAAGYAQSTVVGSWLHLEYIGQGLTWVGSIGGDWVIDGGSIIRGEIVLSGNSAEFLNGSGTFSTPSSAAPAGSGSELQVRATGTTFAAVTGSSASGANVTLAGTLGGITQLNVDNLRADGNTISSTDTDGPVTIDPNGTGPFVLASGAQFGLGTATPAAGTTTHVLATAVNTRMEASGGAVVLDLRRTTSGDSNVIGFYTGGTRNFYLAHLSDGTLRLTRDSSGNDIILDASGNVTANGNATFGKRILGKKGADVASATNITLGDGNTFDITGTTTINTIAATGWTAGSVVILQCDSAVTITHNGAGTGASILLSGAANFSCTTDDTLTLVYDGVTWRETARAVI